MSQLYVYGKNFLFDTPSGIKSQCTLLEEKYS